jgi:murein DD-endopeptidase MepM/ murein hydrolase activator NlpD
VDTARDLARRDPWRESLERSRARREKASEPAPVRVPVPAPAPERRARAARRATRTPNWGNLAATLQVWGEHALSVRTRLPTLGPKSVAAIALLAAIVASSLANGGPRASTPAASADASRAAFVSRQSKPRTSPSAAASPADCPLAVEPAGYVNPLAGATVKPERIDQGVDYAGDGTLVAIGPATVTYVGTSNTGWPGAFIEFRLLAGADAGCYVYYAEGVVPVEGLSVGEQIAAGQPIATIIPKYPTGIELGWGSGRATKAYAKVAGQWSPEADHDNIATPAGKSFSALIAALGGPPGKVEG